MKFNEFDKSFSLLFFIVLLIELLSYPIHGLSNLHFVAKPLLIISLIYFVYVKRFELKKRSRRLMLWALFLSLTGDTLILFETIVENSILFFMGILVFIIVLMLYTNVFFIKRNKSIKSFHFAIVLISFMTLLFSTLWNSLNHMLIPIALYALVLFVLNYSASLRCFNVSKMSFRLVLIGTLLMLVSNTFVVINKFYFPFSWSHELIMSTYGISQYCIVFGVIKQNNSYFKKFNI